MENARGKEKLKSDITEAHVISCGHFRKGKGWHFETWHWNKSHSTISWLEEENWRTWSGNLWYYQNHIWEQPWSHDGDSNAEHERRRLRELLDREYAVSIYGSTAAPSGIIHHSSSSCIALKRAEAAADLAAKEAKGGTWKSKIWARTSAGWKGCEGRSSQTGSL